MSDRARSHAFNTHAFNNRPAVLVPGKLYRLWLLGGSEHLYKEPCASAKNRMSPVNELAIVVFLKAYEIGDMTWWKQVIYQDTVGWVYGFLTEIEKDEI